MFCLRGHMNKYASVCVRLTLVVIE